MLAHLKTKFWNIGWVLAEQGVRILIGLFVLTLVARHLGPERFAAYSYVFALCSLLLPLARFGINTIVVREGSVCPSDTGRLLGAALAVSVPLSVAAAVLAVVLAVGLPAPDGVTLEVALLAALTILLVPAETYLCFLRLRERMNWYAIPRIVLGTLIALLTLAFVWREAGLTGFVTLRALEAGMFALALIVAYRLLRGQDDRHRLRRQEIVRLMRSGLPLVATGLGMIMLLRIDQIMLGQMASERELGLYSVAVRVAEVVNLVPLALQFTLLPAVARSFARDREGFDRYSTRVFDAFSVAAWPAALGMMLVSCLLLEPVFGSAYAGALGMTLLLCAATPFVFLFWAMDIVLSARDWLWTAPWLIAVGGIVNVLLNLWLIPYAGGEGAAVATIASFAVVTLGLPWIVPRLRGIARAASRSTNPIGSTLRVLRDEAFQPPKA